MDQATQAKIWDYGQTTGIKAFTSNTGRLNYVRKLVANTGKRKVLTIGVGDLYLEKRLLRDGVDPYVVDPSEASISSVHESLHLDSNRAMVGYSQGMPFKADSFDVIVMSEVLEHLDDDVLARTIKELHRVLRKGGQFIGTVIFLLDKYLNEKFLEDQGIFSSSYISDLKVSFLGGNESVFNKVWTLLVFQLWYEKWIISSR
ncbi:class I SAM-dependent methyltransferase [Porticoccaceae bacterium]|nr:class I SAM-dependent methyltransferase [Porticoccaceae bacterium]